MKTENRKFNIKILIMILVAIVVWAFAFPFIIIGLKELSFINLTIMRFSVVCTTFLTIFVFKKNRFSKLYKKDIPIIFFLGFFGVISYHLGLNYGEQYITAGAASLIIATIPVFVLIFAAIILKEKITILKLLGILYALIGVIIISLWGTENTTIGIQHIYAALAVLFAAIMGALYTIFGKKLLTRYNGFSLTAYALLLGSIGLIPLISSSLFEEVSIMTMNAWIAVIFLGVFSTVIGYTIWYIVLEIKTASELSIYLYVIPVIATIVSYIWFEDVITLLFLLGGAFVIIGLILVNIKTKKDNVKI
jgi:drug/metabolite transporter (DMT)-like permease